MSQLIFVSISVNFTFANGAIVFLPIYENILLCPLFSTANFKSFFSKCSVAIG